ncbi:hypothetical protein ACWD3J_01725 [Streptomyces sp. NPDC002755]|uniref:hypothetical protein n=1 Tax=Streptomyces sp. NPDC002884 TaxID=3154544 RepID=UPI003323872F
MRGLPVRHIASTALCATLVLGITAPAAMAADGTTARERNAAASKAPVAGTDALLAQAQGLGELGTVLTPVAKLLDTVLKADGGQLTAEQATELGDAVKTAVAKITTATPATPATPADPEAELPAKPADPAAVVPEKPAVPADPAAVVPEKPVVPADPAVVLPAKPADPAAALPVKPVLSKGSHDAKSKAAADPVSDAVAALDKAVAALLAAATSLDVSQVAPAVTGVVSGLLDLISATLAGAGLTLPTLPAEAPAPALPALPAEAPAAAQPALPALPTT